MILKMRQDNDDIQGRLQKFARSVRKFIEKSTDINACQTSCFIYVRKYCDLNVKIPSRRLFILTSLL